jgi:hypothetical protein
MGQPILYITDTGCGIPEKSIDAVMRGESLKHSGNGLGLSGAKKFMLELNGYISISSQIQKGTVVKLSFPCIDPPTWFPEKLLLPSHTIIVIIDDDMATHYFWRDKLRPYKLKTQHFMTPKEANAWCNENSHSVQEAIFFVDHEYVNSNTNGLDFLSIINAKERAILITSCAEQVDIQNRILMLHSYLVPKLLLIEFVKRIIFDI